MSDSKQRSAKRRKTCFPLSGRAVGEQRMRLAWMLHTVGMTRPLTFREIRQVLNLSGPEEARRLVAKARRQVAASV